MGSKCFYGLGSRFSTKVLSKILKIKLCMTLIWPVLLYGSGTWTRRKVEKVRLAELKRKILRRIYGPCIDSDIGK